MFEELRTPLHGIVAVTTSLLSKEGGLRNNHNHTHTNGNSNKWEESILIVSQCADHLLALVANIVDFEQLEANKFQLNNSPFSICKQIKKVSSFTTGHLCLLLTWCIS